MKKIFIPLCLAILLISCWNSEEQLPEVAQVDNKSTSSLTMTQSWNVLDSTWNVSQSWKILESTWLSNEKTIYHKVSYSINDMTWSIDLPEDIWWKSENLLSHPFLISNSFWNENTDLKVPPEWTIDKVWWVQIYDKGIKNFINIADLNLILDEVNKNSFETTKMFDDSDMYAFWFEWNWSVNISLLNSIKSDWISKLPKAQLWSILIAGHSQPEKKVYFTRTLKNVNWETIWYWSACSFSQEPSYAISFWSYCILTFNWKLLKEYTYQIPNKFIKEYDVESNIKSKYTQGQVWSKYVNSDFYKESTKFWAKIFTDLYSSDKEFADFIDKLEKESILNY